MQRFLSVLQENPFLNALDSESLGKVVSASKKVIYPRGKLICQAGEELSKLYIIFSGQARVFKKEADGKTKTLAYLTKSDFFGEMPLTKQEPPSFSVEAFVDSEILEIEKTDVEKIIAEHLHLSESAQQISNQEGGAKYYKLIPKMATQSRPSVVAVYGIEDEIGKTTLAINLAVSLIRETKNSVVLVDLATQEGFDRSTVSSILKLYPIKSLAKSRPTMDDLDESLMTHHTQLRILTLSSELLREEARAPEIVSDLISLLKSSFDYVIIDTHSKPTRFVWEALALSEMILFVTSSIDNEVPAGVLNFQDIRFILNLGDEISTRSIRRGRFYYVLDRDYTTLQTFGRSGFPFVVQTPDRPISRTISRLARDIGGRRVGLALSGRGALGLSQIGVLEVLEMNKIPVDAIVGSGLGAFIGAAYAAGFEVPQIKRSILNWSRHGGYFHKWDLTFQNGRLFLGRNLIRLYEATLKDIDFKQLSVPFNVVMMNRKTGETIIFQEGKVVDALVESLGLASGFFKPLRDFETSIPDAILNRIQVPHLKEMGADIILTFYPTVFADEEETDILFPSQSESISSPSHVAQVDLSIRLDVGNFSWKDFSRAQELITLGIETTQKYVSDIEQIRWER
jgi:NTE family protein